MSMKALMDAGEKAADLIEAGRGINRFINTYGPKYDALVALAGGSLAGLSDAKINAYFGVTLTAAQMVSAKALLTGIENIILEGRIIKDTLPANDISLLPPDGG